MDKVRDGVVWLEKELSEATVESNVPEQVTIVEEAPTLTIATIIGVTVVMLFAIIGVFVLGVLIDCRQQRVIANQMGEAKRWKIQRRGNNRKETENTSIAHNMQETGTSLPPAEILSTIP